MQKFAIFIYGVFRPVKRSHLAPAENQTPIPLSSSPLFNCELSRFLSVSYSREDLSFPELCELLIRIMRLICLVTQECQ
jgi:hypothetical protein